MAKVAGVDVLLYLRTGTDAGTGQDTYELVGGQSGATLNRQTNVIDATSKDAGGWTENIAGVNSWSIECEGFIVTGDAQLEALETAWMNRETVRVQLQLSNKNYTGDTIISDFPAEFPQDGAVTFSLSLTGTGALSIATTP